MNAPTMNFRDTALKQRIMRRVYFSWFLRSIAPTLVIQAGVLALTLIGIHEYVSIRFVGANALRSATSPQAVSSFAMSAFSQTEFISQILVIAAAALAALVLRDVARAWRRLLTSANTSGVFVQSLRR